MQKRPRIAFLSSHDPHDKRSWSGIVSHSFDALQKHCGEVHALGPFDMGKHMQIGRGLSFVSRKLTGKRYDYTHTLRIAEIAGTFFSKKLREGNYDLIFAPAAATELTYLETNLPILRLADSTFARMIDYYPFYTNLQASSIRQGNEIERLSIAKSQVLLYASQWAADSAIRDYGADPKKIHVFPIGGNIDAAPKLNSIIPKKRTGNCRLLFLGVEWERKGGPIAFETLIELNKRGFNASLTVCGCSPPSEFHHPQMEIIKFLNKNDPEQKKKFTELLLESEILLLPTRAECFGLVFCEASAYGIPSITTDTGGIAGAVFNGENGFRLPLQAGGKEYADKIISVYTNREQFDELCKSSRKVFDEKLNWDAWAISVSKLIAQL